MKLLLTHDANFDVCRTFLVVSMVFSHVFEMFFLPDYNRHLTYYVTIGFVFLSGFAIGVLYSERIRINPQKYLKRLTTRACKLFIMFVICNLVILLILKHRLDIFYQLSILEISTSVLLGTNQSLFGFDILIPIALTSLFSWLLLKVQGGRVSLVLIFLFFVSLSFMETLNLLNYYGIKFMFVGLIGCLLGKLISDLDWSHALKTVVRSTGAIIGGIAVLSYYAILLFFSNKGSPINVYYHLIPSIAILFFVYMLSYDVRLGEWLVIKILNKTLGRYMLFAYLFHILVINSLFIFIPKDSLCLLGTSVLALLVLSFTIATCYLLDLLNLKSAVFAKTYSTFFKL